LRRFLAAIDSVVTFLGFFIVGAGGLLSLALLLAVVENAHRRNVHVDDGIDDALLVEFDRPKEVLLQGDIFE